MNPDMPEEFVGSSQDEQNLQDEEYLTLAKERDDWRDKAYRAAADAENTKRRVAQEVIDARQYAVTKFAADVVGIGDNLARALTAPEGNEKALRDGIAMTAAQLQTMLSRHGVQLIVVKPGDALNPDLHQAMSEAYSADFAPGSILQEIQAGFTLNGRLLRPALVVVAKSGE
jgi:molecular chaperone GrpE